MYVAHPVTSYGTATTSAALVRLAMLLPGVDVVDPERAGWPSAEQWLVGWADLLDDVDALVVVPDSDGLIGAGCLREVSDVLGRGRLVMLLHRGELVELAGMRLRRSAWTTPEQIGWPVAGRRFEPSEVQASGLAVTEACTERRAG